jgi:transposase InsO family protein
MFVENPTWGAPRIHGELRMLGFELSERTISRWMKRAPRGPERGKRWLAFLRNHREAIAAMVYRRRLAWIIQCAVKRCWSTVGEVPPGNWFVPPGSNRSSSGGNEAAEASGVEGRIGDLASL